MFAATVGIGQGRLLAVAGEEFVVVRAGAIVAGVEGGTCDCATTVDALEAAIEAGVMVVEAEVDMRPVGLWVVCIVLT